MSALKVQVCTLSEMSGVGSKSRSQRPLPAANERTDIEVGRVGPTPRNMPLVGALTTTPGEGLKDGCKTYTIILFVEGGNVFCSNELVFQLSMQFFV